MTMTEEETAAVAVPDFNRRRWSARLRRWRPLLIAAFVVTLVATAGWLVFFSSVVTVRGVEVSGNENVSASTIEKAARAPIGTPLVRADLAAVQARVEAIPEVRTVSVSRSWLHTIRIEITERVPVAVVSRGAELQAVDLDGVLFGSYPSAPKDLPLIRTAPGVTAEVLAEAAEVVRSLRPDIAARVRFIDVTSIDKISLGLARGLNVMWGSADDSAEKAEVLAVFLKQHPRPAFIDVSVPGKPTTR